MEIVGIKTLKAQLSAYVAKARRGGGDNLIL
jgi:hypothetical protein